MTWNLWTILNTPRLQLTLLDEFVVSLYALLTLAACFLVFQWYIRRKS